LLGTGADKAGAREMQRLQTPSRVLLVNVLALACPCLGATYEPTAEPATLRVYVLASAHLEIEGTKTSQAGAVRRFVSPPLEPGKTYTYTLKAAWKQDGRQLIRMQVADVRAGQETVVDLRPGPSTASSRVLFVPTPPEVVEEMLALAEVTKDDVVYDLGCGDGRIVVAAAKLYGTRGVGIDIDPERVAEALVNAKKEKVEQLVEIRQGDALKVPDLSRATVVTLYMLPEFNAKLAPILKQRLKPGTRVVAHDYALPDWKPLRVVTVDLERQHTIYLWKIASPESKAPVPRS
jgi:uncharacterized protein (TIGR03000 family)